MGEEGALRQPSSPSEAYWDWDVKAGVVVVSAGLRSLLGFDAVPVETSLPNWQREIHPDDLVATTRALFDHLISGGSVFSINHRLRRADGGYLDARSFGVAERDATGNPVRVRANVAPSTADAEPAPADTPAPTAELSLDLGPLHELQRESITEADLVRLLARVAATVDGARAALLAVTPGERAPAIGSVVLEWSSPDTQPSQVWPPRPTEDELLAWAAMVGIIRAEAAPSAPGLRRTLLAEGRRLLRRCQADWNRGRYADDPKRDLDGTPGRWPDALIPNLHLALARLSGK